VAVAVGGPVGWNVGVAVSEGLGAGVVLGELSQAAAINPAATEVPVSARNSRREIRLDILSSPLAKARSVPPNY
jgi:hypothetical protein